MRYWLAAFLLLVPPLHRASAHSTADNEQFSCDAPAGAYSYYQRPLGVTPVHLSATVHVNQFRRGSNWSPVVNVTLVASQAGNRVGFRLLPDRSKDTLVIAAVFPGMRGDDVVPLAETSLKANIPLSISVTEQEIRVSAAGTTRSVPAFSGVKWRIAISCSSIDAHIDDILIGRGS